MSLAVIESVAFVGADASLVQVEVDIGPGMPGFRIVGLPNASVREAEQRVRSALLASRERWVNLRKTANLAPGALRKDGTHFDLGLALGVAAADDEIELDRTTLPGWVCIGELALDGAVRSVPGVLAAAMECRKRGRRGLVCPLANAPEAALVEDIEVVGVATLREAIDFFKGSWHPGPIPIYESTPEPPVPDLRSVRGHPYAKRALEIAAAGGHNLLIMRLILRYNRLKPIGTGEEARVATALKAAAPTAAIYCRISQDGEGSGLGVRRQEQDCRELAERRGWRVATVFLDNDVSAYSGKNRPQYRAMLEAIRRSEIEAVIVWHLDRLTRRPVELEDFFEVCDQAGLKNMACVSGDIDLSTHDGQFHARILAAVARKESDDKSRRIRRKHRELAEAGIHPGSWSMMGYRYDKVNKAMHVVPEEAQIVRAIFDMYVQGQGLREIARWLQDQGLPGKRGRKRWTNGAVARILDNETYAGLRLYQGDYFTLQNVEPIITVEVWEQVRKLRAARVAPAKRREGKGTTLLAGLMFCSCGEPMWRDTYASKDDRSYYVCRRSARKKWGNCDLGGVSARRAERIVVDEFLKRVSQPYSERLKKLSKPQLMAHLGTPAPDNVEQKLAAVEKRMERLIDLSLAESGPLAAKKFQEKARLLEVEREELQRRLGDRLVSDLATRRREQDVDVLRKRLSDLPRVWQVAADAERNQMLRLAISRIEVSGEGRPKKVDVSWEPWLQQR